MDRRPDEAASVGCPINPDSQVRIYKGFRHTSVRQIRTFFPQLSGFRSAVLPHKSGLVALAARPTESVAVISYVQSELSSILLVIRSGRSRPFQIDTA